MGEAFIGIFCILLVLGAIGFGIGWAMRGRRAASELTGSFRGHVDWLMGQLEEQHLRETLSDDQRQRVRDLYRASPTAPSAPAPGGSSTLTPEDANLIIDQVNREPIISLLTRYQRVQIIDHYQGAASAVPIATRTPVAPTVATTSVAMPVPAPAVEPATPMVSQVTAAPPSRREPIRTARLSRPLPPGPPPAPPERRPIEWDPAVLMLYLGAFLVVAAGLVYGSYNWATFGPWQKLGMLVATTTAFAGVGWFLLGKERVRQAAETFIAIGALLVPANAIAAYTVFEKEDARTALIVLVGALATAILYAAFSVRPGGLMYSYGAAIAGYLAIAAVAPAIGTAPNWGAVPVLLATAVAPDLAGRLGTRWEHLRQPVRHVSLGALALAFVGGLADPSAGESWLAPAVLAATTISLARMTVRDNRELAGVAGTFTGIATVYATLIALEVQSAAAWSAVTLVTAFTVVLLAEWIDRRAGLPLVRAVLHGQATAGFLVAATFGFIHAEWLGALVLAFAVAGTALIAWLRNERWWLIATGLYAAACWMSLPGATDRDWSYLAYLRWAIPFPAVLGATGFMLDRRSTRHGDGRWGMPLWIVAGLSALLVSVSPITGDDVETYPFATMAVAFALFALTALVAAWSTGYRWIRLGYGAWAVLAMGTAVWILPLHLADRALVMLVATAAIAMLSIDAIDLFRGPLRRLEPLWHAARSRKLPLELMAFRLAAMVSLLVMLGYTAAFVLDLGDPFATGVPGTRWTWTAYLVTYAAIALIAAAAGYRRGQVVAGDDQVVKRLPVLVLGAGFVAAVLLLRMLTTDAWAWSLAGLGVATALNGWGFLQRQRKSPNAFVPPMARAAELSGVALGAIAIGANLAIAFDPDADANLWLQVAVFTLLAAGVTALGYRYPEPGADHDPVLDRVQRWLPARSLALAGIAAVTLARIATDDPMTWTRLGIGAGTLLFAASLARETSSIGNGFVRRLANLAGTTGIALLAASVTANLTLAISDGAVNQLVQAVIYAAVGLVFLGLAAGRGRPWLMVAAIASLAVAVAFAAQDLGDSEIAVPASLIAFAWLVAGASFPMARQARWSAHQAAARLGALGSGGLALIIASVQAEPIEVTSRAWQVVIFALVSLAGLLAVDAAARRDRLRGILASALALLALLLQIGIEEPGNVQFYTLPVALYLLALGYVERRQRFTRDTLLGMGSGLLLIPPLLQAQVEGDFTQLLLGGIAALVLFVAGLVFQLRVPIAAGVLTVTLIALRMLVDAANALPSWVTLLVGGLILLAGGTILLTWKDLFRDRLARLQQEWNEMG